jgi:3-deoxy-D-manno-octulosonate 8-phosphate phosphatase (KDO 8-P phosphatase)
MSHLTQLFTEIGGQFIAPEAELIEKLKHVKAFVFDWDGVFTDGGKDHLLQSRFNEVDSMGTNLLRFSYYLNHKTIPTTAIISGEKNTAAFTFVDRERFHTSYSKFANKLDATKHLCESYGLQPNQICYVFDDVLDLSLAEVCGLRIFISRNGNPLFNEYVIKHFLADYVTGASSGNFAVREACELLMGLNGNFNEVITERKIFSQTYSNYLALRKATTPIYYTFQDGKVVEV